MNLLLDTHTFLWFIAGDKQLDPFARSLIEDDSNQRFLSTASIWEMTIKASLGRLIVPSPPTELVREYVWANGIEVLPILPEHYDVLLSLPFHHNDPFDRLMISQAIHEKMTLLSVDNVFDQYDADLAWSGS